MSEEKVKRFAKITLETRKIKQPRWSQEFLATQHLDMTGAAISKWEQGEVDPDGISAKAWKTMARLRGWTLDEYDRYLETGERPTRESQKQSSEPNVPPIEFVELEAELKELEQRENLTKWLKGQLGKSWQQEGVLTASYRSGTEHSPERILFAETDAYGIKAIAY